MTNSGDVHFEFGGGDPEKRAAAIKEYHGRAPGDLANRIARDFDYHTVTTDEARIMSAVRNEVKTLALLMAGASPGPSRELSLALTHLEEALFYFIASVARAGR